MKIAELKQLLKAGEWNDVEFKEARTAVPKSAFETVSAFANTHGGRLVFGVAQQGEVFEVTGVEAPDKVQSDFLSVLHADGKVNHDVQVTQSSTQSPTQSPTQSDDPVRRLLVILAKGEMSSGELREALGIKPLRWTEAACTV